MTPEFSRPERLDAIGTADHEVAIEADEGERRALAARFGLIAVDRLAAAFAVRREGGAVIATGRVEAAATQPCAATGEPLAATIDEPVALRFAPDSHGEDATGDEVELAGDAVDTLPIEGGAIDLGEAAAQTMALALDPFARGPAADDALRAAGVLGEGEAAAFGGLAELKAKLENARGRSK